MTPIRLRAFLHRTIILGIISAVSYPLLTGLSWLIHLVMNRGKPSIWASDFLSDTGIVLFVGGLTITTALSIVYRGCVTGTIRTFDPLPEHHVQH